nr:MbeB family mobilization protein [Escherichia coli]
MGTDFEKKLKERAVSTENMLNSEFIDRNLKPKKIKKTPKNGCLFNTACVP